MNKPQQTQFVGIDLASGPDIHVTSLWGLDPPSLSPQLLAFVPKGWVALPAGAAIAVGDEMWTGTRFRCLSNLTIEAVPNVIAGELVIRHPHRFYVLNLQHLPALSIKQPWPWFITRPDLVGLAREQRSGEFKRVENRRWGPNQPGRPQNFRGRFLIHASLGCTRAEYADGLDTARRAGVSGTIPPLDQMNRGGIVGVADAVDWVDEDNEIEEGHKLFPYQHLDDPWFFGPGALVLRNAAPLPFTPCLGMLGFFTPKFPAAMTTEGEK